MGFETRRTTNPTREIKEHTSDPLEGLNDLELIKDQRDFLISYLQSPRYRNGYETVQRLITTIQSDAQHIGYHSNAPIGNALEYHWPYITSHHTDFPSTHILVDMRRPGQVTILKSRIFTGGLEDVIPFGTIAPHLQFAHSIKNISQSSQLDKRKTIRNMIDSELTATQTTYHSFWERDLIQQIGKKALTMDTDKTSAIEAYLDERMSVLTYIQDNLQHIIGRQTANNAFIISYCYDALNFNNQTKAVDLPTQRQIGRVGAATLKLINNPHFYPSVAGYYNPINSENDTKRELRKDTKVIGELYEKEIHHIHHYPEALIQRDLLAKTLLKQEQKKDKLTLQSHTIGKYLSGLTTQLDKETNDNKIISLTRQISTVSTKKELIDRELAKLNEAIQLNKDILKETIDRIKKIELIVSETKKEALSISDGEIGVRAPLNKTTPIHELTHLTTNEVVHPVLQHVMLYELGFAQQKQVKLAAAHETSTKNNLDITSILMKIDHDFEPEEILAAGMEIKYLLHKFAIVDVQKEAITVKHLYTLIDTINQLTSSNKAEYMDTLSHFVYLFECKDLQLTDKQLTVTLTSQGATNFERLININ